jgi:hypothetical protein
MSNLSGEPKTPEGKLISSRNSLKTGVYSKQQFLPGENPEDFDELKSMFMDDFKPVGVVEASLVHEITVLAWKKLRLERVENQFLYGVLNATPTAEEFFAAGLPRKDDIVGLLEDLSVMTEQFIEDHERYLDWAKEADDSDLMQEDIDRLKKEDPDLYAYLKRDSFDHGNHSNQVQRIVITWQGQKEEDQELTVNKVRNMLKNVIQESKAVIYVAKHMNEIEEIKQLIRDRRLKNFMESPGPIRAYQDLSRAFFKVLAELRKQQEWRLQNRTLDLNSQIYKTN